MELGDQKILDFEYYRSCSLRSALCALRFAITLTKTRLIYQEGQGGGVVE